MITTTPKVSIILPTFNRAHLLTRSIESILRQDYDNYELIIVNDGSKDETNELIHTYSNKIPSLQYIEHPKNLGASMARNTGLAYAKGVYIAFQDSDDEWMLGKLRKQVDIMDKLDDSVGIVFGDLIIIRNNTDQLFPAPKFTPSDGFIYDKAISYGIWGLGIQTTLIRRACFDDIGYFDEKLHRYIDLEFFIRLSRKYLFNYMNEPLVRWHTDGNNRITQNWGAQLEAQKLILNKYWEDIKKDQTVLAKHYHEIARTFYKLDNTEESTKYLQLALSLDNKLKNEGWKFE